MFDVVLNQIVLPVLPREMMGKHFFKLTAGYVHAQLQVYVHAQLQVYVHAQLLVSHVHRENLNHKSSSNSTVLLLSLFLQLMFFKGIHDIYKSLGP